MNEKNIVGHVFNSFRVADGRKNMPESDIVMSRDTDINLSYDVDQWIRGRSEVDPSLETLVDSLRRRGRFWGTFEYQAEIELHAPSENSWTFGSVEAEYLDSEAIHVVSMVDERSRTRLKFMENSFTRFSFDTSVEK